MLNAAVRLFNQYQVDAVLHAGDFVSPFSLKPFSSLICEFVGVWGNNDGDKIALQKMARGKIKNSPYIQFWDQRKILIAHDLEILEPLIRSQEFHLIVYGHTHQTDIRKQGMTLVVNPGECGGWLTGKSTVAIGDLKTMTAEIIELEKPNST